MKYKIANIFFILGIIFYIVAGILALNNLKFNLLIVAIGIAFIGAGLYEIIKQKTTKKAPKTASKD